MAIIQISIAIPNSLDMLNEICEILEKEEINIKAIMVSAEHTPFQVHLIVNNPVLAESVLKKSGFGVSTKEVLAVATPDHPGGLNTVLRPLRNAQINIQALYPFVNLGGKEAIIIIDVDKTKEAYDVLKKHWIKTFGTEIYRL